MRVLRFFVFMMALLMLTSPASAGENVKLRIYLARSSDPVALGIVKGGYSLEDYLTHATIKLDPGKEIKIAKVGNNLSVKIAGKDYGLMAGPLLILPQNESDLHLFSFYNNRYRGGVIIDLDGDALLIVNLIGIKQYLYGVIGKEIGYNASIEALKAQAVVSRSYALAFKGSGLKYDLGGTQNSQVYGGYEAEQVPGGDRVIEAVDATAGQVIYFSDRVTGRKELVKAFYHANAGGYTENSENVWNEAIPYLRAVPSPEDDYAEKYARETGQNSIAESFTWKKVLTYEQIAKAVNAYGQKKYSGFNMGTLKDIKLEKTNRESSTPTASGRVTKMEFIGTLDNYAVFGDEIRQVFNLKSTKFDLVWEGLGELVIKDGLGVQHNVKKIDFGSLRVISGEGNVGEIDPGDVFVVGAEGTEAWSENTSTIRFVGFGNGHGLGMSQWGARGMAEKGFTYQEIVEHYYNPDKNDGSITIEAFQN